MNTQRIAEDALVPGTSFHATGDVGCRKGKRSEIGTCHFGVRRTGGGSGSVTVFWPDGDTRIILFEKGEPVGVGGAAQSEAVTRTRRDDSLIVRIGTEEYDIPDAVIWGG